MKSRLIRIFRDNNKFAGGDYTASGIEIGTIFGRLRIGKMTLQKPVRLPSIFYIGKRHTWSWTIRLWTLAVSFLPNKIKP